MTGSHLSACLSSYHDASTYIPAPAADFLIHIQLAGRDMGEVQGGGPVKSGRGK